MFERFTERARMVVVLAQEEARRIDHNYIGAEHLLLGLLREADREHRRPRRRKDRRSFSDIWEVTVTVTKLSVPVAWAVSGVSVEATFGR